MKRLAEKLPAPQGFRAWIAGFSREQWLVLGAAWLGWVFDSMDSTLYSMVMNSSLKDLISNSAGKADIAAHGGIIFAVFLLGWALGGTVFGILADYVGRSKTLAVSILFYAVFTGVAALSQSWQQLMVFRFLTALGIGGEWAAGAALVAESFANRDRARVMGIMQSAWGMGFFLAAMVNLLVVPVAAAHNFTPWRAVLVVGVIPALFASFVREKVGEPEAWRRVAEQRQVSKQQRKEKVFTELTIKQIFWPEMRRDTIVGTLLAFTAVFGLWAVTNWTPTFVEELLQGHRLSEEAISNYKSYATMALNFGAIIGYLGFGPIADRVGRKRAFFLFFSGSLVLAPYIFYTVTDYRTLVLLLPVLGFFNNGQFSGFPIYLSELYPTRLRATGQGFCFNSGRILAAGGPLLTGFLVRGVGSYATAVAAVSSIYLVGLVTLLWARETNGLPLPE